jgi:hypothetical protein
MTATTVSTAAEAIPINAILRILLIGVKVYRTNAKIDHIVL